MSFIVYFKVGTKYCFDYSRIKSDIHDNKNMSSDNKGPIALQVHWAVKDARHMYAVNILPPGSIMLICTSNV